MNSRLLVLAIVAASACLTAATEQENQDSPIEFSRIASPIILQGDDKTP